MTRSSVFRLLPSALLPALLLVAGFARAAEVRPVARIGFDFGGDNLITVPFTDGTSDSIRANEGFSIGGGALFRSDLLHMEAEVTLSYKFTSVNARNGDVTWTRFPIDALVFYRLPQFRLGGGLTYHLSPSLDGSGAASNINATFDDALGFVLQADYLWTPRYTLGARYTSVTYKTGGVSFSGKGLGTTIGFVF